MDLLVTLVLQFWPTSFERNHIKIIKGRPIGPNNKRPPRKPWNESSQSGYIFEPTCFDAKEFMEGSYAVWVKVAHETNVARTILQTPKMVLSTNSSSSSSLKHGHTWMVQSSMLIPNVTILVHASKHSTRIKTIQYIQCSYDSSHAKMVCRGLWNSSHGYSGITTHQGALGPSALRCSQASEVRWVGAHQQVWK